MVLGLQTGESFHCNTGSSSFNVWGLLANGLGAGIVGYCHDYKPNREGSCKCHDQNLPERCRAETSTIKVGLDPFDVSTIKYL